MYLTKIYTLLLDILIYLHRLSHILTIFMKWLFWKMPLHYYLNHKYNLENGNNNTLPYSLGKIPKHVTLFFLEDDINMQDVVMTILFFMTAGISVLSLTDYKGTFSGNLQNLIELNLHRRGFFISKSSSKPDRFTVKNSLTNKMCEIIFPEFLFGRNGVVKVSQEYCLLNNNNNNNHQHSCIKANGNANDSEIVINESNINQRMKDLFHSEDPDMAVQFGHSNIICPLNPWLIRTTEFFHLATHRMITQAQIQTILHRFARSEQRWGR